MKSRAEWNNPSVWCRLALLASVAFYLGVGLHWLNADSLPRDGDEEGHVGAAELVMQSARESPVEGIRLAVAGDLGHYPPLYPGVVGLHWAVMGAGDPGRLVVRGVNLIWPLLAAWAIWGWLWSNRWNAAMHAGRLWLWLCCTGWTYLLSQLMSRRAMKFLPLEGAPHRLHVPMEESIENVAHIMLIVCAFADRFVRRPPDR